VPDLVAVEEDLLELSAEREGESAFSDNRDNKTLTTATT